MSFSAEERDRGCLLLIMEMVEHLERRTGPLTEEGFQADRDEIDLAAFRLAVIGEESRKLSGPLKQRHPDLGWTDMYAMRNVISHDYTAINPQIIWQTITRKLADLRAACERELGGPHP